jgi:ferrous iron transport protein B
MLVAPLMSCSARLPVYTLLIAAFVPDVRILGVLSLPGLTLLGLYLLGIIVAVLVAWVLRRTILPGAPAAFIMELPPYALPTTANIFQQIWNRAWSFLQKAGTIILGASILLWFLATYPKLPGGSPAERLQHSAIGRIGAAIAPAVAPLGFDWKIGIGLVTAVFQREMFVSTMGTLYNIDDAQQGEGSVFLRDRLRQPNSGFTPLTAFCVMIYYVLALQCLSTIAVMHRETGGWRWPIFQAAYMTGLAYAVTWIVRIAGHALGAT